MDQQHSLLSRKQWKIYLKKLNHGIDGSYVSRSEKGMASLIGLVAYSAAMAVVA
jgi:hypothetical protein